MALRGRSKKSADGSRYNETQYLMKMARVEGEVKVCDCSEAKAEKCSLLAASSIWRSAKVMGEI